MKTFIVDTNIVLRYLIQDQREQFNKSQEWFFLARDKKINLVINPIVIAECCFVLESYYEQNREEISQKMGVIVGQRWLKIDQRKVIENCWQFYLKGFHFVDSYLLSWSKINQAHVLTFDKAIKDFSL